MLVPGTKIKSTFENEIEGVYYGEIVSYQEETSCFAEGYFVNFENRYTIFLSKRVIDELYIPYDVSKDILKNENKIGQLSMEDFLF